MASKNVLTTPCKDGSVFFPATGDCLEIEVIVGGSTLIQGGDCWPAEIPITRPLRRLIAKVALDAVSALPAAQRAAEIQNMKRTQAKRAEAARKNALRTK